MNVEQIISDPLTSVGKLIDLYESLVVTNSETASSRWAFRGQPQPYGTLVPSFQRQFAWRSYGTAELIEQRLIETFRRHYRRLPDRSADMPRPSQIDSGFDLRCLSAMQHYETPTRLLDWTSNLWIAVYFACASDPDAKAELWYYDRQLFEEQRLQDTQLRTLVDVSATPPQEPPFLNRRDENLIVELDPQITPRMKQQAAHHTVSTNVFSDHAQLILTLQGTPGEQNDTKSSLHRVLIDGSCKGKTLQFLADHKQITASTIFPDVVGLGRFLRWQFESLRTMLM